jgi:hypothetical protein
MTRWFTLAPSAIDPLIVDVGKLKKETLGLLECTRARLEAANINLSARYLYCLLKPLYLQDIYNIWNTPRVHVYPSS